MTITQNKIEQMVQLGWIRTHTTLSNQVSYSYGNSFCSNIVELIDYVKTIYNVNLIKKLAIHNMNK